MYIYKKVEASGCNGWDDESEYYVSEIKYTGEQLVEILESLGRVKVNSAHMNMPMWYDNRGWKSRGEYEDAEAAYKAHAIQKEKDRVAAVAQHQQHKVSILAEHGLKKVVIAGHIDTAVTIVDDSGCCCYSSNVDYEEDYEDGLEQVTFIEHEGHSYISTKGQDIGEALVRAQASWDQYYEEAKSEWEQAGLFKSLSPELVRELSYKEYEEYEQARVNYKATWNRVLDHGKRPSVVDPKKVLAGKDMYITGQLTGKEGVHLVK